MGIRDSHVEKFRARHRHRGAADISLFHVAAARCADATRRNRIAVLNGPIDRWLHKPTVPVVMSLSMADPARTGGLSP